MIYLAALIMSRENSNINIYTILILAMICWGLSFIWYKQAIELFKPITIASHRLLLSTPLLVIVSLLLKRLKKIQKKDIPIFLLIGFLEPFLYSIGESFSMQYLSSTVASIIIATIPIFTFVTASIFLKEKLTGKNYIGMFISVVGVLCVVFAEFDGLEATGKGIALLFISVGAAIVYGMVIKRIASKYNPLSVVTYQNLVATIFFIPIFFIVDFRDINYSTLEFKMFLPIIYLAVFASTLGYVGFIQGIRKLGVAKATVFANFIPVVTAIAAFFILDEKLLELKIIGIVIATGGLILSQHSKKGKGKAEEIIVDELY